MLSTHSATFIRHLGSVVLLLLIAGYVVPVSTAQEASPVAEAETEGMGGMLARVPAVLPGLEEPELASISYSNIRLQLATVGVEPPDDGVGDPGAWFRATTGLPMPSTATRYLELWRDSYGFDLYQVHETFEVAAPPYSLTLFRGDIDPAQVRAKLDELGYTAVVVRGVEAFNLRGDFEMDLREDVIPGVFASMNNAVFLPDGTLAFAAATSIIEAVVAVANGEEPSLAQRVDVAALLPHLPDDLVAGTLVSGTMLAGSAIVDIVIPEDGGTPTVERGLTEGERLPLIVSAILGSTAGGPIELDREEPTPLPADTPDARAVAAVLFLTPDDAEAAAPIIEERIETGTSQRTQQPFTEIFTDVAVRTVPGERVVTLDLTLGETNRSILLHLLYARDLLFLAW